jgi:hypothetical protein
LIFPATSLSMMAQAMAPYKLIWLLSP